MTIVADPPRITLVSRPYRHRVGLIPLIIAVAFGWIFVIAWTILAISVLIHNIYWSVVLLGSTSAFALFLGFMTYSIIRDSQRQYLFEVTDTEAVLQVVDRLKKQKSTQMVLLDDVEWAEYYPYSDSSCIIFHSPYTEMEVPLWPMGGHAQDVVDFLQGRGVKVVNVQFDDAIPDR